MPAVRWSSFGLNRQYRITWKIRQNDYIIILTKILKLEGYASVIGSSQIYHCVTCVHEFWYYLVWFFLFQNHFFHLFNYKLLKDFKRIITSIALSFFCGNSQSHLALFSHVLLILSLFSLVICQSHLVWFSPTALLAILGFVDMKGTFKPKYGTKNLII